VDQADISLANSIKKLGYEFEWIKKPSDFDKAEVNTLPAGSGKGLIAETPLPRCRSFRTSYDLSPNFRLVAPFTKVHCNR
jgi:hypothetical protein